MGGKKGVLNKLLVVLLLACILLIGKTVLTPYTEAYAAGEANNARFSMECVGGEHIMHCAVLNRETGEATAFSHEDSTFGTHK